MAKSTLERMIHKARAAGKSGEAESARGELSELRDAINQRNTAWGELRFIRDAIGANPEESTYDEVQRVLAELREAKQTLRDVRPEIDSLIKGLHHSHVTPSDGIVHDEDVAHEIAQLTELHERIVRVLTGRDPQSSGIDNLLDEMPADIDSMSDEEIRAESSPGDAEEMRRVIESASAPHTPEQAGDWANWPDTSQLGTAHVKQGPPQQAHGDALVDEIAPPIPPFNSEAEEEEYHCEAAVRHYSERVRERLRRHLTASGVPYVPENIRNLPEKLDQDEQSLWRQGGRRERQMAEGMRRTIKQIRKALASAPAVRDPIDILESNDWGLVPISAPTGGDDFDVQWTVVSYHMAEPKERVIGRGPTPRDALSDAAPF